MTVTAEELDTGERTITSRCRVTFVCLSAEGKVQPVPQLLPKGAIEQRRFAMAKARKDKAARLKTLALEPEPEPEPEPGPEPELDS